ncbi:hypothetical protein AB0L53_32375 [Nonomuraea sp. NPDC052129]|uniref:hypothetical protein n=1 Tax=Nonomuraea sp. NPDC052129 TaxID=3154651 RepID=UPI00341DD8E7
MISFHTSSTSHGRPRLASVAVTRPPFRSVRWITHCRPSPHNSSSTGPRVMQARAAQAWRFTSAFAVPFTNNPAEQPQRMVKLLEISETGFMPN